MTTRPSWPFLFALLLASCSTAVPRSAVPRETAEAAEARRALAEKTVESWGSTSALAARRLIDQYGAPDEVRYGSLVWNGNGPWLRTVARDVRPPYEEPEELGVIEQSVPYPVTPAQRQALHEFDPSLALDIGSGEIASRADREEMNFLRLNLVDDVARGRMTPEQARGFRDNALALERSGKSSPYLLSLRFGTRPER